MGNLQKTDFNDIKNDWLEQSGLKEEDFNKEASFAMQHLHNQPYLQKSSKESLLKAVLNVAQTGLTLNPVSKYAYLVPRNVKRNGQYTIEAVLEPSYVGLVKLLTDTGSVRSIETHLVYEGDDIDINMAHPDKVIKHIPYVLNGKEKGKHIAVYSIANLHDGSKHFEFMDIKECYDIRARSESYKAFIAGRAKSCIWDSDEGEMIRKTIIKRHYKYLPKTDKARQIEEAIGLDNESNGFRAAIDISAKYYAYELLEQNRYEDNMHAKRKEMIDTAEYQDELQEVIKLMHEDAPEALNMSQGDIQKKLDEHV